MRCLAGNKKPGYPLDKPIPGMCGRPILGLNGPLAFGQFLSRGPDPCATLPHPRELLGLTASKCCKGDAVAAPAISARRNIFDIVRNNALACRIEKCEAHDELRRFRA